MTATDETRHTPNSALRAARLSLHLSQGDLAREIQKAGIRAGQPNDASKRLVQRWESGDITTPRPVYARALEQVTGLPLSSLGFSPVDPLIAGQHHGNERTPGMRRTAAPYTGIWLSRYTYTSSGRDSELTGLHHVVVLQHRDRLTVKSLPNGSANPDSPLSMELTVDGTVVTGTWTERTAPGGYYRGAVYHGAIQLLIDPTGRRMTGQWVGFGKDMDVNTGPWELTFLDADTSRAAVARYNRPPGDE